MWEAGSNPAETDAGKREGFGHGAGGDAALGVDCEDAWGDGGGGGEDGAVDFVRENRNGGGP